MRTSDKALQVEGIKEIYLSKKRQNLQNKCLAFADDLALATQKTCPKDDGESAKNC